MDADARDASAIGSAQTSVNESAPPVEQQSVTTQGNNDGRRLTRLYGVHGTVDSEQMVDSEQGLRANIDEDLNATDDDGGSISSGEP